MSIGLPVAFALMFRPWRCGPVRVGKLAASVMSPSEEVRLDKPHCAIPAGVKLGGRLACVCRMALKAGMAALALDVDVAVAVAGGSHSEPVRRASTMGRSENILTVLSLLETRIRGMSIRALRAEVAEHVERECVLPRREVMYCGSRRPPAPIRAACPKGIELG
jgi:hypothetical protein